MCVVIGGRLWRERRLETFLISLHVPVLEKSSNILKKRIFPEHRMNTYS